MVPCQRIPPTQLGAAVVKEALARANIDGEEVGNVIQTEPRDMYLARVAALEGGVAAHTPAVTLNRLCGSGLQAILSAAQSIALGDADIAVAGGAEGVSRALRSNVGGGYGRWASPERKDRCPLNRVNTTCSNTLKRFITTTVVILRSSLLRRFGTARRDQSPANEECKIGWT